VQTGYTPPRRLPLSLRQPGEEGANFDGLLSRKVVACSNAPTISRRRSGAGAEAARALFAALVEGLGTGAASQWVKVRLPPDDREYLLFAWLKALALARRLITRRRQVAQVLPGRGHPGLETPLGEGRQQLPAGADLGKHGGDAFRRAYHQQPLRLPLNLFRR
jgi:hypothetical protein